MTIQFGCKNGIGSLMPNRLDGKIGIGSQCRTNSMQTLPAAGIVLQIGLIVGTIGLFKPILLVWFDVNHSISHLIPNQVDGKVDIGSSMRTLPSANVLLVSYWYQLISKNVIAKCPRVYFNIQFKKFRHIYFKLKKVSYCYNILFTSISLQICKNLRIIKKAPWAPEWLKRLSTCTYE